MLFHSKQLSLFGLRKFSLSKRNSFKVAPLKHVLIKEKRNIGIIAHIDAGKTTTTERLLYLTGFTSTIGNVDNGNTITDYMDLERERGITIQAAAISTEWRHRRINLIDTPGHVDFTLEVERTLRVMDGIVTVLDGSAGAQTLTVWRQARKFNLPAIFFVNKMDKKAANFEMCIQSVENRLSHSVVPITVPVIKDGDFVGLIDLLSKSYLDVKRPDSTWAIFNENKFEYDDYYHKGLENLISKVADVDEHFEKIALSESIENILPNGILDALKRATLLCRISPISCGTAFRSPESVRPVLDMIVDFLPNPNEKEYNLPTNTDLCALIFKITHDKRYGQLSYARIYKGLLKAGVPFLNANRLIKESNFKLYTAFSDILQPVDFVEEGDIAVIGGLKQTISGDTLIDCSVLKNEDEIVNMTLPGITSPEPVFSCSIEPPSTGENLKFEKALSELCIEDPSIKVYKDQENGQTILQGMGELHIEIIKERLKRDYKLNVFLGALRVGYREILNKSIVYSTFIEDKFTESDRKQWCSMKLELVPTKDVYKFKEIILNIDDDEEETPKLSPRWLNVINEGCTVALYNGPVLGYPVTNLKIYLRALTVSGNHLNIALLNACASKCVSEALLEADMSLIEPLMLFEITLIDDAATDSICKAVLNELYKREATIENMKHETYGHFLLIRGKIPISETPQLSKRIRILSSGLCSIHMEFAEYQIVLNEKLNFIKDRQFHGIV